MSTRFKDHPTLGYDFVKCQYTGEVVNPDTGKKIVCFICRQNITVESELERVISKNGKRRKIILDQPHAVYRGKRFVLQHVNCVSDASIREDYSTDLSESSHELTPVTVE